ncbi:hypothetical protein [Verrucomicrobium sp. BvORR106]|uniref:hypothetical protein n=1 Tax=Verrucomicrobium sp. BvORR106 TaxID=1403819 RepID=UPI002240F051|nr:hypothetical protein [Verrucomicrobium sp. BvORR106]
MALALILTAVRIQAHPIPTLVVEAIFHPDRACELKVNLDPRLFLHEVPSTLPPVPGSWWRDQDETERAKNLDRARQYLAGTLQFVFNSSSSQPPWEVQAIDSMLNTEISATTAEVHLLARCRVNLPTDAKEFKVTLARNAAVPVILLNSELGNPKVVPQSVYPGESSRAFSVPVTTSSPPESASVTSTALPNATGSLWRLMLASVLVVGLAAVFWWSRPRSKA